MSMSWPVRNGKKRQVRIEEYLESWRANISGVTKASVVEMAKL